MRVRLEEWVGFGRWDVGGWCCFVEAVEGVVPADVSKDRVRRTLWYFVYGTKFVVLRVKCEES